MERNRYGLYSPTGIPFSPPVDRRNPHGAEKEETMYSKEDQRTRILVEGAVLCGLSVALSYVKLWQLPQGGSITLENLPLFIYAYRHGLKAGVLAGGMSGLLQLLLGGYMVHPLQALLDYPLAFAALASASFVRKPFWAGLAIGTFARFLCHFFSGVVFFASYAPEGTPVWLYSAIYNGTFMVPALVLNIALGHFLLPRLLRLPGWSKARH